CPTPSISGEGSSICALRPLVGGDNIYTIPKHSYDGPVAIIMATEQRGCYLCCLPLADVLARSAGSLLPASQRSAPFMAGLPGNCISRCSGPAGNLLAQATTLHLYRLVLVYRHARARDRLGGSRRASARRSIHLPATDRVICADYLG